MAPVKTQEGTQEGKRLLDVRDRSDRRYPRVITFEEIESMPRLPFSKGCASGVFISRERDDARYFYQGLCFHDADMEEFKWMQSSWDETYYCMKGVIRVAVTDDTEREKVFDIKQGEHFYLPAGYTYTLKASGVESINFWTLGPAFKAGLKPLREIDIPEAPEYVKTLRAMRED
jgi:mannose-6-phosphate isomerase-like protein (cupin superfamily)